MGDLWMGQSVEVEVMAFLLLLVDHLLGGVVESIEEEVPWVLLVLVLVLVLVEDSMLQWLFIEGEAAEE